MRASFWVIAGVALSLATPVFADPAYTTNDAVDFLLKQKNAKFGKTRSISLDPSDQPDPQPKTFDLLVNFEFDSDRLTPEARDHLDRFAAALRDPRVKDGLRTEKLAIDGYTDATGTEIYNQSLSERRAIAVVNYLAQKGVDRNELVAKGFGPKQPRAADPFDAANRRVETHWVE